MKALIKEFTKRSFFLKNFKIKTLYIGGGTPSVLEIKELEFFLRGVSRYINIEELLEFTFEVNPESVDADKIRILKEFRVNRISLGLQSVYNDELKFLGRIHDYESFLKAYELLKNDFVLNIDLIYGLPNQKKEIFIDALRKIVFLRPHHISLYALEIHKNTRFYKKVLIDEDLQKDIYLSSIDFLEKAGYVQYEISNFSLPNFQSLHNNNYWDRGNYIGFGPSASSCFNNIRWKNISNLSSYIKHLNNGKIELEYIEELSFKDIMNERLMLLLRTMRGVSKKSDVFKFFEEEIISSFNKGYLEYLDGSYRLKREYIFVFNSIVSAMLK